MYVCGMFRAVREGSEALRGLRAEVAEMRVVLQEWPRSAPPEPPDLSAITERLDRIEVGYAKWEAEAEATLLKADAVFKNARNAEERTRSKLKASDADETESTEFEEAMAHWLQANNAEEGEENGVPGVRPGVEVHSRKALALRAKFA